VEVEHREVMEHQEVMVRQGLHHQVLPYHIRIQGLMFFLLVQVIQLQIMFMQVSQVDTIIRHQVVFQL